MKNYLWLIGVLVMVGLSGCNQEKNISSQPESTSTSTDITVDVLPAKYTIDEVADHNTKDDCWLIISDKVYNVSDFGGHPGGEAIYEGCGQDATVLFETRPMGTGTPHSDQAREYLINFYIGDLEQ